MTKEVPFKDRIDEALSQEGFQLPLDAIEQKRIMFLIEGCFANLDKTTRRKAAALIFNYLREGSTERPKIARSQKGTRDYVDAGTDMRRGGKKQRPHGARGTFHGKK